MLQVTGDSFENTALLSIVIGIDRSANSGVPDDPSWCTFAACWLSSRRLSWKNKLLREAIVDKCRMKSAGGLLTRCIIVDLVHGSRIIRTPTGYRIGVSNAHQMPHIAKELINTMRSKGPATALQVRVANLKNIIVLKHRLLTKNISGHHSMCTASVPSCYRTCVGLSGTNTHPDEAIRCNCINAIKASRLRIISPLNLEASIHPKIF